MHDCIIAYGEEHDKAGHVQESGHDTGQGIAYRDHAGVVRATNVTNVHLYDCITV